MPDTSLKPFVSRPGTLDDTRGVTLEERARLVLWTLGNTPDSVRKAYRKMARRHHPDKAGGDTLRFQVIKEAYELLTHGSLSKRPLLADDALIVRLIGRQVQPLIDKQKDWKEYERWSRRRFYGENGERI